MGPRPLARLVSQEAKINFGVLSKSILQRQSPSLEMTVWHAKTVSPDNRN
jgi:hypothetical protein